MKSSRPEDLVVRNDLLKLLYATMLLELPFESVKEFWKNLPLKAGNQPLPLESQLRHIWDDHKTTPFSYVAGALNALEPFLVSHDRSAPQFVDRFITGLNKGALINVSSVLKYFAPFLKFLFNAEDLRYFSIRYILPFVLEKVVPSIYCSVVKQEKVRSVNDMVLALAMDRTFCMDIPPYDAVLFIARPLQLAPTRMGLPPLEDVAVIGDVRSAEAIVGKEVLSRNGDSVRVNGIKIGSCTTFRGYCRRHGISFGGVNVPDSGVVEIHSDYRCPRRRRVVLYKGCVYGAPLYLMRLKFHSKLQAPEHFLSPIINESLGGNDEGWKRVNELHSRLMSELGRKVVLTFRKSKCIMFANGKKLARSAPARILRSIVARYIRTGGGDFSNSDFTNDITYGEESLLAENFSLRLQRLSRILSEKLPELRIVKRGRGRFQLLPQCRLEFREEP